jgi:hypothetical protein
MLQTIKGPIIFLDLLPTFWASLDNLGSPYTNLEIELLEFWGEFDTWSFTSFYPKLKLLRALPIFTLSIT